MKRRLSTIGCLVLSSVAFAQSSPSPDDQNRNPIYAGPTTNAAINPQQAPLAHFPPPVGAFQTQPGYRPPRPGLNPYLNLFSGAGGLNAVDYYNYVRPAQQSLGSYVGRQPGPYTAAQRYGSMGVIMEPEVQLEPGTSLRTAGTSSAFMNTGRYFNSMGTIGTPLQVQQITQQPQQQQPVGRR